MCVCVCVCVRERESEHACSMLPLCSSISKDYRIPKTCHSYSFERGKMQRSIWPLNRRKPRLLSERANR